MEIVIIGTGNTATVLGHRLKKAGHTIGQVWGRDAAAASKLAYELQSVSVTYWNIVNKKADIYIIAVSDMAIADVVAELQLSQEILVHTAASVSKSVLQKASTRYGVFYPLQTLKKEISTQADIPILIDASDQVTLGLLERLGHTISSHVVKAGDEERKKLHLAAVFCNNFVNYLYWLAEDYCSAEGLDFSLMLPLIQETANRIEKSTPGPSQTGAALRKDEETIKQHRQLLQAYPELEGFYNLFTQSILTRTKFPL
ncbi:MAG: DUF2520 domain-containing protein [Flavisolibacter sp.]